jgi:hypothetical protein
MYQTVDSTLTAVAIPYRANKRVPVVPAPARYIVSAQIIDILPAADPLLINVNTVPRG